MLKAGTAARRRSLEWEQPVAADAIRQGVEAFVHALDSRLVERDPAWVGHCKLLVAAEGGTAYASKTAAGDQLRWSGAPVPARSVEVTIYMAIYGWSDADVAQVLDATLTDEPLLAQADLAAG